MDYLCAKFGDFGLSHFGFRQTDRQTESQPRMIATASITKKVTGILAHCYSSLVGATATTSKNSPQLSQNVTTTARWIPAMFFFLSKFILRFPKLSLYIWAPYRRTWTRRSASSTGHRTDGRTDGPDEWQCVGGRPPRDPAASYRYAQFVYRIQTTTADVNDGRLFRASCVRSGAA